MPSPCRRNNILKYFQSRADSNQTSCPMPGTASRPVPLLLTLPVRRRPLCACTFVSSPYLPSPNQSSRTFGTSLSPLDDLPNRVRDQPRWQSPPPRMVAPGPRLRNNQNEFSVNENPETLDRVLNKVLGKGGNQMLTEDVKWLAVTHKSFDHGRRGFNDRLAFFGMRTWAKKHVVVLTLTDC